VPKKFDVALGRIPSGKTVIVVGAGIRWSTDRLLSLSMDRLEASKEYAALQTSFVKDAMDVAGSK
jgi:hypothetical protein